MKEYLEKVQLWMDARYPKHSDDMPLGLKSQRNAVRKAVFRAFVQAHEMLIDSDSTAVKFNSKNIEDI